MGWVGIVTFEQEAKAALPKGKYTLTYYTYNNNSGATRTNLQVGFVEAGGAELLGTVTDIVYGSWIKQTVSFDIESETLGQFKIIAKSNQNASSNKEAKFFIDGIKLEYAQDELTAAKMELQSAIDAAPVVYEANVGTGAFQYDVTSVTSYGEALSVAQTAHDADDATVESLSAAKTALENAIAAYNALTINEPAQGQLFAIVLTYEGYTYDKKAMTLKPNAASSQGNYRLYYQEEFNVNLAQAFTFTKVEGNKYQLSIIGTDGTTLYLTDSQTGYGGDGLGIRVTTDKTKAAAFTIIPTSTEGVYNIYNNVAKNYIGSQDQGVYTVNSHINFKIVETTKPSITINTFAAGWGTVILPFSVTSLPEGVKAYTCADVDGATLNLTPVDALEANKPYIIEGEWNETLTGDAQGTKLTYTEGLLTGTYARIYAPNGSYILQNNDSKVGFYLCDEEDKYVVAKNRCYLTPDQSNVKAFFFGEQEDAINNIRHNVESINNIYDLTGRQVNKATKGIYIVNGKKVLIK